MGAASQGSQTFTMNVTNLPGGINVRVYKTTLMEVISKPSYLTLGSNSITVGSVGLDRDS